MKHRPVTPRVDDHSSVVIAMGNSTSLDDDRIPRAGRTDQEMASDGDGFYGPFPPAPKRVMENLRSMLALRQEWGEVPEVGVLTSPLEGTVTPWAFPLPDGVWKTWPSPGKLVARLGELAAAGRTTHPLLRGVDPTHLVHMVGVYVRVEAMAEPAKTRSTSSRALIELTGGNYAVSDTSDAEVRRTVLAQLINGDRFHVSHIQGKEDQFQSRYFDIWNRQPGPDIEVLTGKFYNVLVDLMHALVRHVRPPYANRPNPGSPE